MTAGPHKRKPPKLCAAPRHNRPGTCANRAGFGTDHVGSGRCKFHGGSTPSGRQAAAREAALEFAAGALGGSVAGSPLDAMQEAVELARGLLAYYRHELAAAAAKIGTDEEPDALRRIEELRGPYSDAIKLETTTAKAALDAGVAERRQALAESVAELVSAAIAEGLREVFGDLATAARRAAFAEVVKRRLVVFEGDGPPEVLEGRELPRAA